MSQIYGRLFSSGNISNSHIKIISLIGSNSKVLEIGSSTGYITKELNNNGCKVDIVEIDKDDVLKAQKFSNHAYIGSIEDSSITDKIKGVYDVILAADIIEHLKDTERFLIFVKNHLNKNGKVIVSLPNIACWAFRRDIFFKGKFEYTNTGLLDKTHIKFFTYYSIQKLLKRSGFEIKNIFITESSYPFRFIILRIRKIGRYIDKYIGAFLTRINPNLFSYHLVIETTYD